ncbi:hypothetical protein D3C86_1266990 [compost metagenome]
MRKIHECYESEQEHQTDSDPMEEFLPVFQLFVYMLVLTDNLVTVFVVGVLVVFDLIRSNQFNGNSQFEAVKQHVYQFCR